MKVVHVTAWQYSFDVFPEGSDEQFKAKAFIPTALCFKKKSGFKVRSSVNNNNNNPIMLVQFSNMFALDFSPYWTIAL